MAQFVPEEVALMERIVQEAFKLAGPTFARHSPNDNRDDGGFSFLRYIPCLPH